MPNYNYLLPASLSAPAPTNALAQPRMVNYGALAVNQQPAPGSDDAIYQIFQSLAKQGAANRKPIMRPDGALEVNPMTQKEIDYVNHPSVKWIKEHDEQGRLLSELPDPWKGGPETVTGPSLYNRMPSQEYQKHMRIVGELAKRNPKVRIAAGIGYEPMVRPTDQPVSVIPLMENTRY